MLHLENPEDFVDYIEMIHEALVYIMNQQGTDNVTVTFEETETKEGEFLILEKLPNGFRFRKINKNEALLALSSKESLGSAH